MGEVDKGEEIEKLKEEIGKKDLKIEGLETNLKRLQEENEQLKQKATKNIGVDTSSLADQKEKSSTAASSAQTVLTFDGGRDFFDEKQNIAGADNLKNRHTAAV